MFSSGRSRYPNDSFSKHRASKSTSSKQKRSFRDASSTKRLEKATQQQQQQPSTSSPVKFHGSPPTPGTLTSAIITLCVGREQRLFAAHEDVLCNSPYFQGLCRGQFFEPSARRIDLPDEEPEVFSCVLEYLYKGDYTPKLEFDKKRNHWQLQDGGGMTESTVFLNNVGVAVLKDTVIYCTAEKYGLTELKRLALRKQGLVSNIQIGTILTSARYAYAQTPDNDSNLRAHYLALIIRSRSTFKRSGTMQMEMEAGGRLFFDLFVAMVNHMDEIAGSSRSPTA